MEFTQEEKDRIIAEEKLRYETVKGLQSQGGGKCCSSHVPGLGPHGCCRCGSLLKGVILGLVLAALFCFFMDRHHCGQDWGRCSYNSASPLPHPDASGQEK
jgi:hypothetical protein